MEKMCSNWKHQWANPGLVPFCIPKLEVKVSMVLQLTVKNKVKKCWHVYGTKFTLTKSTESSRSTFRASVICYHKGKGNSFCTYLYLPIISSIEWFHTVHSLAAPEFLQKERAVVLFCNADLGFWIPEYKTCCRFVFCQMWVNKLSYVYCH